MQKILDTSKTHLLIHKQTNLALQAFCPNSTSIYTKDSLQLGPINQNNPNQMWIIVQSKDRNKYEIVLGMPDVLLTANGSDVMLRKGIVDKSHQYWEFVSCGDGFQIRQNKHEHCYLGYGNHRIYVKKEISQEAIDIWQLRQVTKNDELNQCCYIQCLRTYKLMDLPQQGSYICILEPNYRFSQRWKIYKAGQVYIIKSLKTKQNLDVEGAKYQDGTAILQYRSGGGHNQFWRLQEKSKGYYRICCWFDPTLEIGNNGKKLFLNKGDAFVWKIDGYIPEI